MEKQIKIIVKILLLAFLLSALAGCNPEGDEDFSLPRDRYKGSWFCQEDADPIGYYASITPDPYNSTQVIIDNFFNLNGTVTAIVTEGTITVNNQVMKGIPGTYWCEGYGTLTKNKGEYVIHWSKYGANNDETTSTYTKQ
jgi:hypothetical protein